jgi:hypothetical protein
MNKTLEVSGLVLDKHRKREGGDTAINRSILEDRLVNTAKKAGDSLKVIWLDEPGNTNDSVNPK